MTQAVYAHLPISQIILRREELLHTINKEVETLNRQFQDNPLKIEADTIKQLFDNLQEINSSLESRKREHLEERKKNCFGAKKTTWAVFGLGIVSMAITATISIYNLSTGKEEDQPKNIALLSASIFGIFLQSVLGPLIQNIDQDNDFNKTLVRISEVKQQGEDLKEFIKSFVEFKESLQKSKYSTPLVQSSGLAKCIRKLDQIDDDLKTKIPPHDLWVSHMIQILPEDHPLKKLTNELKEETVEALRKSKGSSSTLPSKHHKHHKKSHHSSEFEGEKLPFSAITSLELPKEKLFENTASVHLKSKKYVEKLTSYWSKIEKELGTQITCLQVDDIGINRDGQVAPSIRQLLPDETSSDHVIITL